MARLFMLVWIAGVCVAGADGGRVIGVSEIDGIRVLLFGQPDPLRAGLADLGVYLEKNGTSCLDASVGFRLIKLSAPSPDPLWAGPGCLAPGVSVPAILGHAGNKLVYSAVLGIPESGIWELAVDINRDRFSTALFELKATAPAHPLATWWPLVLMVPAGVTLFAWRSRILSRRQRQ